MVDILRPGRFASRQDLVRLERTTECTLVQEEAELTRPKGAELTEHDILRYAFQIVELSIYRCIL